MIYEKITLLKTRNKKANAKNRLNIIKFKLIIIVLFVEIIKNALFLNLNVFI